MIATPILVFELRPFDNFSKYFCTLHNSVTIEDICTQLYRNVLGQNVVSCSRMIAPRLIVSELCTFNFFPQNSCTPNYTVAIQISSCNFLEICIRTGRHVARKNDCFHFLSFQILPLSFFSKHSCMLHNSVTVLDIFMQLNRSTP